MATRKRKLRSAANAFFAHKFPVEIGYRKNDVAIDPDAILSDRLAMRPFDVTLRPMRCRNTKCEEATRRFIWLTQIEAVRRRDGECKIAKTHAGM